MNSNVLICASALLELDAAAQSLLIAMDACVVPGPDAAGARLIIEKAGAKRQTAAWPKGAGRCRASKEAGASIRRSHFIGLSYNQLFSLTSLRQ